MVFECSKSNSESGSDDNQSDDDEQPVKKNLVSVVKTTGALVQAPLHRTKRLSAASILVHVELEVQSTKVSREPILILLFSVPLEHVRPFRALRRVRCSAICTVKS